MKEPAQRYAAAAELAADLDRFARGEPLAVRPPTPAQRFWGWTRRQPALASRLALGLFYGIEMVNYRIGTVGNPFHGRVSIVVAVWAAASIACQQLVENRRWSFSAKYLWGTLDSAAFLTVLLFGDGAASSLIVIYPLIIAGSGLWFRCGSFGLSPGCRWYPTVSCCWTTIAGGPTRTRACLSAASLGM